MSIIEKAIEKARRNNNDQNSQKTGNLPDKVQSSGVDSLNSVLDSKTVSEKDLEALSLETKNTSSTSNSITIHHNPETRERFLYSDNNNVKMFEQFRNIKRPILNNAFGTNRKEIERSNLILITSSHPGEGKTFVAINLAISIASELNKKVLLVDADVAKPSISRELGISSKHHGLIDYLDGEDLDFSKMMLKTDISGLNVIPSGKNHSYSTELLASDRMVLLADELHSRYSDRIVIFDSPPILAATQAEVLASLVGQVILVVEAENTVQSMVVESLNRLKVCDVVMTLLNKSVDNFGIQSSSYLYGKYGY